MPARLLVPVVFAMSLCGCSSIDGSYRPACTAYEGDEIELANGRFTWNRFTDMRQVDEKGERVEPFPDYPKSGIYDFQGSKLDLQTDSGEIIASFYLQDDAQGKYMLTHAEHEQMQRQENMPECALRRVE